MLFRKQIITLSLFLIGMLPLAAQQSSFTGRIVDGENRSPLPKSTVQLYKIEKSSAVSPSGKSDTTFVGGAYADERGRFTLKGSGTGSYQAGEIRDRFP